MTLEEKQISIEEASEGLALEKYHKNLTDAITQGRFDDTREGLTLMKVMFDPINSKIAEYLGTTYRGHTHKTQNYIKLMSDDSREITFVIIKVLVTELARTNNKSQLSNISIKLVGQLKRLHFFNRLKKDNPKLHAYLGEEYRRASARRKEALIEKHINSLYDTDKVDNEISDLKAGAHLLEVVLASGMNLIVKKKSKQAKGKTAYFLSFTKEALDIVFDAGAIQAGVTMQPMIVEPANWSDMYTGGYLSYKMPFIKIKRRKDLEAIRDEDLSKVYPVVNKLQKTPWRVNKRVSEVIEYIFSNNLIDPKSPPSLPRCYGDIPTPNALDVKELMEWKEYKKNPTPKEKEEWHIWNKKREQIKIGLDGEQGRRLQFLLTMNMMKDMKEYDRFWYVYQVDYRGRVYPHTDFFNPQSKGYVKSMLEFADGHELTEDGIKWLRIHIANSWGLDKAPFVDRVKWTLYNRTKILTIANDPIGTLSEWTEADSPYEFLAGCFAYQDYIEGRKVHLPLQLDAVNSGVQFYSGLLLDKEGAESCCVIGNDRSDLYGLVANRVNEKLANGEYPKSVTFNTSEGEMRTCSTRVEAKSLEGKVTRSMTKTNVMTVPYSVTMRGMKMQNWATMDKLALEGKKFWEGDEWVVNYILTELNYESIFEIVKGARIGQQYLRELASLLDEPALWHTPIYNFPVRQPVFKKKAVRVKTPLGTLELPTNTTILSKQKQLSGIAANFIHSIDSTLLLYCVENMSDDIGVIHDCFLVHPNNGEEIRNHYKEGFIEIMSRRPLQMISNELDPTKQIEVPCVDTLNLDEVRDSMYIIS